MSGTEHSPFEGPEKLLEIWFASSPNGIGQGLRAVPRRVWEDMLEIVQCKVLSVIHGNDIDAYLLSESSLFIERHRLILKTCGTTLNLLGLPRILAIAMSDPSLNLPLKSVYRAFYSRKTFMFPDFQQKPHSSWDAEVAYLDGVFTDRGEGKGNAYVVGKVNGDYWLLWMISPGVLDTDGESGLDTQVSASPIASPIPDCTIEILMSDLSAEAREPFFATDSPENGVDSDPRADGQAISSRLGLNTLFPLEQTDLDSYAFTPCGYSANAIIKNNKSERPGEGYYTIHVTPEAGWSYASFESNVPLPIISAQKCSPEGMPDLQTLITRVVRVFRPRRLTLTLFVSCMMDTPGEASVDDAHRAFARALGSLDEISMSSGTNGTQAMNGRTKPKKYKRTDKINYEFGGYDLAFASFELRS